SHSFDHLVGEQQERVRDIEPHRLCGLEVHDQFVACGYFERQVTWLRTLENSVHQSGRRAVHVRKVASVGHQAARIRELAPAKHGWQLEPIHHGGDVGSCGKPERGNADEHTLYVCAHDPGGYGVEVTEVADLDELYGHTNGARRGRQSRNLDAVRWIVGIEQGTDAREARYRELEKIEPLTHKCVVNEIPCPVTLPPGLAVLCAYPAATGSSGRIMTIGIVRVTVYTAKVPDVAPATMTSGLSATSSRASGSMLSGAPFP